MKPAERAYKTTEVAAIMGLKRQSINRLIDDGVIPCVKLTERIFYIPGSWVQGLINGTLDTSVFTTVQTGQDKTKQDAPKPIVRGKQVKK